MAELAEQLGAEELAVHGRSILTFISRWTGRLDEAVGHYEALARLLDRPGHRQTWLGWAAGFVLAVAGGATSAAPPFPPVDNSDPVAGISAIVIRAELAFSGRLDEALARFDSVTHDAQGATADAAGVIDAISLVLAGRHQEARPRIERAIGAARVLEAGPTGIVARALLAEIDGEVSGLPEPPVQARSVADLMLLRAHALAGSEVALVRLQEGVKILAMPGLLAGVRTEVTSTEVTRTEVTS